LLQGRLVSSAGSAEIDQYYRILVQGVERVAGREARVVQIIPRDEMRYGYIWSLDLETGLLPKALLLDEQPKPVHRFHFIELELVADPAEFNLDAGLDIAAQQADQRVDCASAQGGEPSHWVLRWLPPRFEFSGEKFINESSQMLMYTDGLTAFSVFIQPRADRVVIDGRAQRGATSIHMGAVSDGRQDYRLSVVGEIPGAVAERLA
jgi:sigma-E factor negative regulatory protein RseB